MEECRWFDSCKAPLCPMQENTLKDEVWYPDEKVCCLGKFKTLPWIKKQKKIAKLRLTADDGFFTVKMLEAIYAVTRALKGADSNKLNSEKKWLKRRFQNSAGLKKRGDSREKSGSSRM